MPLDPPGPPGIQTTVVFWPAKLQASDRVVMFRFEFWDCGESALKKFEHMLPACKENADAFLFLFSFTDRASFEDLPGQLARVAGEAPGVVRMVIGSKYPLGAPARSGGPAACLCHAVGSSSAGSLEAAPGPPAD
uniref:REM2- and Rab-like small GTPase 1 n=1 Tax=Capra hircus TaxID=9925 RepID=A0A8C2N4X0_CAPHI